MENENEFKKGTFEKIDEKHYKINGHEISCLDEDDMELLPILRDILVQKENITIEDYNLSKPSYAIDGDNEVPVTELITEINKILDSLTIIRQKVLKNGICYYETKNRKLSVEEELIPLVEDIINEKVRPIKAYGLQKEVYLINDEKVFVNDIVLKIYNFVCRFCLEPWRIDGIHYHIKGEDFYLDDDDVQIINELINDKSDLTWSKYRHKKCIYDINGNECFIINLILYIDFLLGDEVVDDKVSAELKGLCLRDKLEHDRIDFAEKVYCFSASLPPSIRRLLIKGEKEYNDLSTVRLKKNYKEINNHPRCEELSFTVIMKGLLFFFENPFEQFFEGTSEEMALLLQKFDSENEENFSIFLDKELKEKRLHPKNEKPTLDDILEEMDIPYKPVTKVSYCYLQAFVNVHNEEYEQWKDNMRERGILSADLFFNWYLDGPLTMNSNFLFLFWYYYFEGQIFDRFFHAINRGFIRPEVIKSTIDKLHELGLSKYAQERYDEYRKLTGEGKDFCFAKLDVKELSKKLSSYYSNLPSGKKNHSFTDYYLFDIVNDVIPNLESGLDVAAFALLLWESKLFQSSKDNEKFTSFRDDIARIFQLDNIPNISKYTAGKPKVKEKANKLMGQFECLERLLAGKSLT
ncbi:hypothetical protein [Bacteroides thetaiotaomicron]|uniref:Uncharacterized protein n=3 Tax=Bacteroides thetaiotaomicron TaxID=818 RepID=A0AAW4ZIW2_BACT4|nr:hypothetical protein [Bacteroides thetaiotaomicron]MCE9240681.1 hypothetical protein [Bacteroides thetaiotaomicron]MCE9269821.1 hypothetical protein [Bacteroides thetaiotaomicron]MCE9279482.1 hypothetical protein [Bacteroides thetaiotaomicron]MCE9293803.1 hypothetical protein [Bacteroides thetaiotaomicron]